MIRRLLLFVALLLPVQDLVHAAGVEVTLHHNLDSDRAVALALLAERFNEHFTTGRIVVEKAIPGPAAGRAPNLVLLEDDDDRRLLGGRRFLPIEQFMAANGARLDAARFYPALRDAVDDAAGRLQALPVAYFLPVLYYNKEAFRRAGIDAGTAPKTWWDVQASAGAAYDKGTACPYTSSWPVWVHLENVSTQHGEPFVAGAAGATRLNFNSLVHVKHVALLSSWFKSRYFHLFGDANEADARFLAGHCAMLTSGSDAFLKLKRDARFDFGMAELPYYDDVYGVTPGNTVPGGGSLWVLAGGKTNENRLAAGFVAFLLRPEIQKAWVQATGFLPMTAAAGLAEVEGLDKPIAVLLARKFAERRQLADVRHRNAGYQTARSILDEELASVWENRKPAKEALDTAVARGNAALRIRTPLAPRP